MGIHEIHCQTVWKQQLIEQSPSAHVLSSGPLALLLTALREIVFWSGANNSFIEGRTCFFFQLPLPSYQFLQGQAKPHSHSSLAFSPAEKAQDVFPPALTLAHITPSLGSCSSLHLHLPLLPWSQQGSNTKKKGCFSLFVMSSHGPLYLSTAQKSLKQLIFKELRK